MEIKILYRYEGYGGYDLKFPMELLVHRETKCMYVVYFGYMTFPEKKEKFIPKEGRKRFAYPTKEEALVNYKARKRSQIEWNILSIRNAEKGLFNSGETISSVLKENINIIVIEDE